MQTKIHHNHHACICVRVNRAEPMPFRGTGKIDTVVCFDGCLFEFISICTKTHVHSYT